MGETSWAVDAKDLSTNNANPPPSLDKPKHKEENSEASTSAKECTIVAKFIYIRHRRCFSRTMSRTGSGIFTDHSFSVHSDIGQQWSSEQENEAEDVKLHVAAMRIVTTFTKRCPH